jgi:hypothetical protein
LLGVFRGIHFLLKKPEKGQERAPNRLEMLAFSPMYAYRKISIRRH